MEIRDWAHKYVDAGWNIFPLLPSSKRPHFNALILTGFEKEVDGKVQAEWESFQSQRVTHELVDAWWDIDPKANIALVCGRISGVTVIDIDTKHEPNPKEAADKIRSEVCDFTMASRTGSMGLHLFCQYAQGVGNSTKTLHKMIDIRGDGGYVVLPPSIHDETGRTYSFDPMTPFNPDTMAEFPMKMLEQAIKNQDEATSNAEWKRIFGGVEKTTEGRNNAISQIIGKLIHGLRIEFNDDEAMLPVVWDLVEHLNTKNRPPLSKRELQGTFKSITGRAICQKSKTSKKS